MATWLCIQVLRLFKRRWHKEYWSFSHGANYHRAYMCVDFIRAEGLQRICKDCVKGFTTVWVLCAGINLPYFAVQFSFMAAAASAIRKAPLTLHCGYPFGGEWHEQWLSKTQWFMSHDASVSSGSHVRWCSNWNIQRSLAGLNYSIAIAGKDLDL